MILEQFRLDIRAFLKRTGLSRTRMGKLAVNDPHAVLDWLANDDVDPRISTIEKVYDFMNDYELREKKIELRENIAQRYDKTLKELR